MGRFNQFEIILTIVVLLAIPYFFERVNRTPQAVVTPTDVSASATALPPKSDVKPTESIAQNRSSPRPVQPSTGRSESHLQPSPGRRADLTAVPLAIDDAKAVAITRAIREPQPGEPFGTDVEISIGTLAVAKMKTQWRLVKVNETHSNGDLSVSVQGSEMIESRVERSALRQLDASIQPHLLRSGQAVAATDEIPPGTILEALRPGLRWRSVSVLRVEPSGEVAIHYINWSRSWDEIIPRSNLRFPTGATVD